MRRLLTPANDLMFGGAGVVLRGVQPVVNGRVLTNATVHVIDHGPDRLLLSYAHAALQGGRFALEVTGPDAGGQVWLRYRLEELPPEMVLDAFGLRFTAVDNLRAWLRPGYTSWDGDAVAAARSGDPRFRQPDPVAGGTRLRAAARALADLSLSEPVHLLDWVTGEAVAVVNGRLLCVSPMPLKSVPEHLPI